jgi:hypothetical protein
LEQQKIGHSDSEFSGGHRTTLRIVVCFSFIKKALMEQIDVSNAFLHAKLTDADIYMKQPEGIEDGTSRICKLHGSLDGFKQAPLNNYRFLVECFKDMGYEQSEHDWCLFAKFGGTDEAFSIFVFYVDDLLHSYSNNEEGISMRGSAMAQLQRKMNLKVSPTLDKYLGLNLSSWNDSEGCSLSAESYLTHNVAAKYDMYPKPGAYRVPMTKDPNEALPTSSDFLSPSETNEYRRKLGSIMFAAHTFRHDLTLAVSKLARASKRPTIQHMEQLHRTIQTAHYKISYNNPQATHLQASCDAAFGGPTDAHTGYVVMLGGGPVTWSSKRQVTPTLSSAEVTEPLSE